MKNSFTVSSFANWVFQNEVGSRQPTQVFDGEFVSRERERMLRGRIDHRQIDEICQNHLPRSWKCWDESCWSVIADSGLRDSPTFTASSLTRVSDGTPITGRPDVVFVNNALGRVVIIERKSTRKTAADIREPHRDASGWPNCQAQLWAYSHLEPFANFAQIYLVLQPWHRDDCDRLHMGTATGPTLVEHGNEFDRRNLARFRAFGGQRVLIP
jgi:hypothetical protein